MQVNIHREVFNDVYFPHLYLDDPIQIYYGGASSGKSVFVAQKLITGLMTFIGFNVMVVRYIAATNNDSTFAELCKVINDWEIQDLFKINRSHGGEKITCINGNQIIFKGLDNVEKLKSTTFKTGPLTVIWVEEASEIKEKDFNQLRLRLRGQSKLLKFIILSFNPIDADHWIKKRFFDIQHDNVFILKTTYKDNKFLTEEDRLLIESYETVDNYYYTVYALGEWGIISTARVFNNIKAWDFNYDDTSLESLCNGMDFGFVHAATLMRVGFREDKLFIYYELYFKGLTNSEFVEKVESAGFDKNLLIVADSAEPDRIKEFKQAGFNIVGSKKGKGSLKDGIDFIKNYEINIHKTNCPNAVREFPKYKRRELKDGTIVENEFVEIDDDTIAGVRYATEHLWKSRQRVVAPKTSQFNDRRRSKVSNLPT